MDLPNLEAFVTVARTASFSEAAHRLHLTQPAISKRVATLEQTLGRPLFDRIGRGITLTEAGRALLPRAEKALEAIAEGRRAIADLSGRVAGRLNIGTSHHIGLHRLPPLLSRFHEAYPAVRLDIRFMDSEQACRAVESGELELAVVTLPLSPSPALHTSVIWPDPLAFVTSTRHPLAQVEGPSLAGLVGYPAVLPARNTYTRQTLEQTLLPLGLEPRVELSTNYLETIKMLVSVGLGWSVLPETMVDETLAIHRFEALSLSRDLGLVEHRSRTLSNAAAAFRTELTGT